MRPRPQLVLLDVDFTLIRPRRVFDASGYAELGARFGARLEPDRYEQARLDALHVWRVATLEHRSAQQRLFAIEIVRRMGATSAEAEAIGDAAEEAWGDPGNFELFPDVEPLLEVLRASGCTVGLVSNTDRELGPFAAELGISVDFALASRAHGRRKPCTTIFAAALALGGAAPEAAVMVGDSLDDDIAGAAGSGLRAVLVDRFGRYPEHPGERIVGLDELPAARPGDACSDSSRERMTPPGVVLDLDGVLLAAGAPIPGAAEAVRSLQEAGHACAVLTNMTSARPADLSARLAGVGIDLAAERIVTAAVATAAVVRASYADARVLLVAERGSEREFAGCRLVAAPPADLVVVSGPDDSWTLSLLDQALRALQGGARLIAMQGNAWWLAADGPRLDSGAYVHALSYASGVRPRVIGKPAAPIFRTACRALGLPPAACVMVGDDLRSDVLAAQRAGLRGVLVRTGKGSSFADDPRAAQAAAVLDSVADVPVWLSSGGA